MLVLRIFFATIGILAILVALFPYWFEFEKGETAMAPWCKRLTFASIAIICFLVALILY